MRESERSAGGAVSLPNFERSIQRFVLITGFPAVGATVVLLAATDWPWLIRGALAGAVGASWLGGAWALRRRLAFPLQTLTNILAAFREGDYSLRARGARSRGMAGDLMRELNSLGDQLLNARRQETGVSVLLEAVMDSVETALFTFDDADRLSLVNPAGADLLAGRPADLLGRSAKTLGLDDCLGGPAARVLERSFPGRAGRRWDLKRSQFRSGGRPHRLLVLHDVSSALRQEERIAWQRLIRVLGHELNNSLGPIESIAESLEGMATDAGHPTDLGAGLRVIRDRAAALNRFMAGYARLARLPSLVLRPLEIGDLIQHVAVLEPRLPVKVDPGPPLALSADRAQLEQALINLVRNAADAALETGGEVTLRWRAMVDAVEIAVIDSGPGIAGSANLFVPFFTTKADGSGIGLALSRQIAETHGGTLTLQNRTDGTSGCVATLRLPIDAAGYPT